jgi:hypothetical protein
VKKLAMTMAVLLATGCAGNAPNPVASSKASDQYMNCEGIKAEQSYINQQVAILKPETKKGVYNTAMAVTGVFFIVPFFFMDLTDSEKVEIKAYQNRYMELDKLAGIKECGKSKDGRLI